MNAALRGDAVIEFPITGECWVLNPPGHSRWALDLLALESGSGAVAEGGWWRYLTCRLRSSNVSGWARPVGSSLNGEFWRRLGIGGDCSTECSGNEARRWVSEVGDVGGWIGAATGQIGGELV
jgi:hypothetical protein